MLTEYNGTVDPTSNASCYAADFRWSGTAISSNRAANSCNKLGTGDAEMNRGYRETFLQAGIAQQCNDG